MLVIVMRDSRFLSVLVKKQFASCELRYKIQSSSTVSSSKLVFDFTYLRIFMSIQIKFPFKTNIETICFKLYAASFVIINMEILKTQHETLLNSSNKIQDCLPVTLHPIHSFKIVYFIFFLGLIIQHILLTTNLSFILLLTATYRETKIKNFIPILLLIFHIVYEKNKTIKRNVLFIKNVYIHNEGIKWCFAEICVDSRG